MKNAIWIGRFYFHAGFFGGSAWSFVPHWSGQVVIRLGRLWINFGMPPRQVEVEWWRQRQRLNFLESAFEENDQAIRH